MYSVYVMKESSDIYHEESVAFSLLEEEQKELYMENFKKVLGGQLDEKMFIMRFARDVEDSSQEILYDALGSDEREDWQDEMNRLVSLLVRHFLMHHIKSLVNYPPHHGQSA